MGSTSKWGHQNSSQSFILSTVGRSLEKIYQSLLIGRQYKWWLEVHTLEDHVMKIWILSNLLPASHPLSNLTSLYFSFLTCNIIIKILNRFDIKIEWDKIHSAWFVLSGRFSLIHLIEQYKRLSFCFLTSYSASQVSRNYDAGSRGWCG